MERFTPVSETRTYALTVLRLASEAITEGHDETAQVVIAGLEPEPAKPDEASILALTGTLQAWAAHENQTVRELGLTVLSEP